MHRTPASLRILGLLVAASITATSTGCSLIDRLFLLNADGPYSQGGHAGGGCRERRHMGRGGGVVERRAPHQLQMSAIGRLIKTMAGAAQRRSSCRHLPGSFSTLWLHLDQHNR